MDRYKVIRYGLLLVVGLIVVRLFWIQIIEHSAWVARADEQHTLRDSIVAKRGEIYMMDGKNEVVPIVMNKAVWTVVIDPVVADSKKVIKLLERTAAQQVIVKWDEAFANQKRRYLVVAKNVERKAAQEIQKAELAGLWLQKNNQRVYPEGDLASRTLGFVNADGVGNYGIEGALDKELVGKNGILKTVIDANRVALSIGADNVRVPAVDGKDIVLTIDRSLQKGTEKILANAVARSRATNASAIVLDPQSGKILAMANVPNYNPAEYAKTENAKMFTNYTVDEPYEAASICKTFTFAAAVNEGVMTPETTYTNTGATVVDGTTIKNAYQGQYGTITMQTVLNYSLNTGSTQALRLLSGSKTAINAAGREKLYDYYHNRFGFGSYTGVELLESPGLIAAPNDGYAMNLTYANMTFGQGLNITMVQAAAAFASIVNGGNYYRPTLVEGEVKNGKLVRKEKEAALRQTVTEKSSKMMRTMLFNTRQSRRLLGIDRAGYYVGGKTGTGQVVRNGKYTEAMGETIASYLGFGGSEAKAPAYVIMVKVWGDGQHLEGERNAMPLFDELSNYVQNELKIRPRGA